MVTATDLMNGRYVRSAPLRRVGSPITSQMISQHTSRWSIGVLENWTQSLKLPFGAGEVHTLLALQALVAVAAAPVAISTPLRLVYPPFPRVAVGKPWILLPNFFRNCLVSGEPLEAWVSPILLNCINFRCSFNSNVKHPLCLRLEGLDFLRPLLLPLRES